MEKQPTIERPITNRKEKKAIAVLRKVGLSEDACARTARLLLAKPTPKEKRKWQQIGVMMGNKLAASNEEMNDLAITVCLWDLMWQGKLIRITDPTEIAAQLKFEEESRNEKKQVNFLASFSPNSE